VTMPSRRVPGGRDDPYAERRARQMLVETFAYALPESESILAIVHRSGLHRELISMAGSPIRIWTAVLQQAVEEHKIDTLLDEVLAIDPKLTEPVKSYQEANIS
jgi:hypothetical protein